MEIKIRTYLWNKDKSKILNQCNDIITDKDLCQLIEDKYNSGEYNIRINYNKEDIIFESTIDEIKIN